MTRSIVRLLAALAMVFSASEASTNSIAPETVDVSTGDLLALVEYSGPPFVQQFVWIDPVSGARAAIGSSTIDELVGWVTEIAFADNGDLFVGEEDGNEVEVVKVDLRAGALTRFPAWRFGSQDVGQADGFAYLVDLTAVGGQLYALVGYGFDTSILWRLVPATGERARVNGGTFGGTYALGVAPDEASIYVAVDVDSISCDSGFCLQVAILDPANGSQTFPLDWFFVAPAPFAEGLHFEAGRLFVLIDDDTTDSLVYQGVWELLPGPPATSEQLCSVVGVDGDAMALDADLNIYFSVEDASINSAEIRRCEQDGSQPTIQGGQFTNQSPDVDELEAIPVAMTLLTVPEPNRLFLQLAVLAVLALKRQLNPRQRCRTTRRCLGHGLGLTGSPGRSLQAGGRALRRL